MSRASPALRAYRAAIRLLWPRALRHAHGAEAVATADALAGDARRRGRRALCRYWRLEFTALARVAWSSRRAPADLAHDRLPRNRSRSMFENLVHDFRYALRLLRRTPGFTAIAVLTLALAIGANTAIFSVVNAVLVRPVATPEPERLVVIREHMPDIDLMNTALAPAEVVDLAAHTNAFERVAAYRPAAWNLTGSGVPVRVEGALTLGDFFELFRVQPHLGRLYSAQSSTNGGHGVVVLSYGAWQRYTGADPSIIGRTIQLDGQAREVVGVLPRGFDYPRNAQIYQPLNLTPALRANRGMLWMVALARLQPGITPAQLDHTLAAEAARWNEQHHAGAAIGKVLYAVPLTDYLAGRLRLVLLVLMGAVVLVLLIACVNIGSLQLVRTAGRLRELAVRTALGAGRLRVARQLLVEQTLLAGLGGGLGLWLGALTLRLLARWDPAHQQLDTIHLDARVLAFTGGVSIAAAVALGTIPALRVARVDVGILREASRGGAGGLWRSRLLRGSAVIQIGLALVLLVGSGLMIRSLQRLLDTPVGFVPERIVAAQVALPVSQYDGVPQQSAFYDAVLERLRSMPGIEAASIAWALPFSSQIRDSSPFDIVGRPAEPGGPERHAEYRVVGGDYFRTMGIPLLRGRSFEPSDDSLDPARRVALIDEHFANQFFPGEDPVGRRIEHARGPATIIGVVGSVHHGQIGEPRKALSYYHFRQTFSGVMALTVRSSVETAAASAMIRASVRDVDPGVPLYDVATMEQRVRRSLGDRRLAAVALSGFAGLSILLATLGVYGVMRYSTSHRTHEIGLRMALGASRAEVVRMVLREGMGMAGLGVVIGVGTALALTRLMEGLLFGINARDPLTFAAVTGIVVSVALLAILLPARRAARIQPIVALRAEQ